MTPPANYYIAMPANNAQLILCNCPDAETANHLAELLVAQQLAACVNCLPQVRSVYRWQGKVETAVEVTLLIKTTLEHYSSIEKMIAENHPNEVPEVLAISIDNGLPAYLKWLENSV